MLDISQPITQLPLSVESVQIVSLLIFSYQLSCSFILVSVLSQLFVYHEVLHLYFLSICALYFALFFPDIYKIIQIKALI